MFYSLLGRLVWASLKSLLRYRYGRIYMPKSVLAGGAAVALAIALTVGYSRASGDAD